MSLSDIAHFNQGRSVYNKEWTPGITDEITIKVVDVDDTNIDTDTVKYFKKRGSASGFVVRLAGDSMTITSIQAPAGLEGATEEFLRGDPITVGVDTAFSWTKRIPDTIKEIKIRCASASTHVRLLVF